MDQRTGFSGPDAEPIRLTRTLPTICDRHYDPSIPHHDTIRHGKPVFETKISRSRFYEEARSSSKASPKRTATATSGNFAEENGLLPKLTNLRAGFSTHRVATDIASAHVRRYEKDAIIRGNRHASRWVSEFFQSRKLLTPNSRRSLWVRPLQLVKTTFSIQIASTEYQEWQFAVEPLLRTSFFTRGGLDTGKYDSQIYLVRRSSHPASARLFNGALSINRPKTPSANGDRTTVGEYKGDTYRPTSRHYVLSETTDSLVRCIFPKQLR